MACVRTASTDVDFDSGVRSFRDAPSTDDTVADVDRLAGDVGTVVHIGFRQPGGPARTGPMPLPPLSSLECPRVVCGI
jgi:hypothetical protein